jgi:cytoskeletal protein CcmA (bactofilin family)
LEPVPAPPSRRFSDARPPATVIGAGTTVRGDLTGHDPVEIRGTLEGDCRVSALCVVAEGAHVLGNVEAEGLVVAGAIEAGQIAADRIEIRRSALVRAAIRARVVAIADGAFYEGEVQMQGPGASDGPVYFKDRREGGESGSSKP